MGQGAVPAGVERQADTIPLHIQRLRLIEPVAIEDLIAAGIQMQYYLGGGGSLAHGRYPGAQQGRQCRPVAGLEAQRPEHAVAYLIADLHPAHLNPFRLHPLQDINREQVQPFAQLR